MGRIVTEVEMASRTRMAKAKSYLTDCLGEYLGKTPHENHLTAIEWINVLSEVQLRMVSHGLNEFWCECNPAIEPECDHKWSTDDSGCFAVCDKCGKEDSIDVIKK